MVWWLCAVESGDNDAVDDGGGKQLLCQYKQGHALLIVLQVQTSSTCGLTPRVYPYLRSRVRVNVGSDILYPVPDPPYPYLDPWGFQNPCSTLQGSKGEREGGIDSKGEGEGA